MVPESLHKYSRMLTVTTWVSIVLQFSDLCVLIASHQQEISSRLGSYKYKGEMSQHQVAGPGISTLAARLLKFSPSAWLKSWLLYLGVQTHVGTTTQPGMKPLHNVCEYLHALHIYTDEARRGEVRTVSAHHFCSHVRKGKWIDGF